jgi:hypothetical protein
MENKTSLLNLILRFKRRAKEIMNILKRYLNIRICEIIY